MNPVVKNEGMHLKKFTTYLDRIKGAVGGRLILWHYKNNRKWQTLHSQIARLTMSRLTNTKTINNKVMLQVVSFQDSRPQQSFCMHTHPN